MTDGAYFSQGYYRPYHGLGGAHRVDPIVVRWPKSVRAR